MNEMFEILKAASDSAGIETGYTDLSGNVHSTDPATALKILEAKGLRIDPSRLDTRLQVEVFAEDELPERLIVKPAETIELSRDEKAQGDVTLHVKNHPEFDGEYRFDTEEAVLAIDEKTGFSTFSIPFPADLPIGDHEIDVAISLSGRFIPVSMRLIMCPACTYMPTEMVDGRKVAGVQIALYGVRSHSNWGCGDLGDLRKLVDWAADDLKVDVIGLNPLHALGNERPFNSSPYNPSSRFFRNFIYLHVPAIPDFKISNKAASLLEAPATKRKIQALRDDEHVNYEQVAALKLEILREVFRAFMENQGQSHFGAGRWSSFQSYIQKEGVYLRRYATFCALEEHFKNNPPRPKTWQEWPKPFQNPLSPEVATFQRNNEEAILFWKYLQWQLDEQLKQVQAYAKSKGMLLGLYHDEALAVDRNGADFWAWREFFHDGFRVGAPPDDFAPDGQDWGFPPPDSQRIRAAAYEPFLRKLYTSCDHGGALRIDHVMQLSHLFWIPQDGQPKNGVYVEEREADLLNLVALVSGQSKILIIGEDLGTVPPVFRKNLMAKGIFSYRLFYFERDMAENQNPYKDYPEAALVAISTHDLPTFAGFWMFKDVDVRMKTGQLDADREAKFREDRTRHKAKIIERLVRDGVLPDATAHAAWETPFPTDDLHRAVLAFTLKTPAKLVVINQEDLFLDTRQQNLPGTTWENPNWVTKMKFTVEDLTTNEEAKQFSERFAHLVEESGRALRK